MEMEIDQEALDLSLMNAHLAVENYQAEAALFFLGKIELSQLAPGLEAIYHSIEGQAKILLKDYATGITALRQAIKEFEKDPLTTPLQIGWVRNWIGIAYYEQGYITQALEEHRLCLKAILRGTIEDTRFCLKAFLNLGNDYLSLGQKDRALDFYRQALAEAKNGEDREDLAGIYWAIGLAYRGKGNLARAKLYLGKSTAQFVESGDLTQASRVRNLLGLVMIERKEYKIAEQTLKVAFNTAETLTNKDFVTLTSASTNLAFLYKQQEKWIKAEEWGTLGLGYAENLGDFLQLSQAQAQLAEIKVSLAKEPEAIELFNLALTTIEQTSIVEITRQIYHRYGSALREMGRLQEAFEIIDKGYKL